MAKFDDGVNNVTVFDADKLNNINRALKDNIESSGQTVDASNTQSSKALANYVGSANFYTDSGVADAYVLSTTGSFKAPTALVDGLEIRFRTSNPNSGASTINVSGLGVVNIKLGDGTSDIPSGFITSGSDVKLRYDASNTAFIPSNYGSMEDVLVNGKLNTQPNSATISSGAITYTGAYMVVDTEGAAASDDLVTISGGVNGDRLTLRTLNNGRDVVLKHSTGNIFNIRGDDIVVGNTGDVIELIYNGTFWVVSSNYKYTDFLNSKSTNGYTYLPNGLIFQWGTYSSGSHGPTISLPITFPNTITGLTATPTATSSGVMCVTSAVSASSFVAKQIRHDNVTQTTNFKWIAIGY